MESPSPVEHKRIEGALFTLELLREDKSPQKCSTNLRNIYIYIYSCSIFLKNPKNKKEKYILVSIINSLFFLSYLVILQGKASNLWLS